MNLGDMKLIDWAKRYRDELGFSVIPIPRGEKGSRIHWERYQERKPTDRELEDWFSGGDSNIGIVCGEMSDLAVLDFETPEFYAVGLCNGDKREVWELLRSIYLGGLKKSTRGEDGG